MSTDPKDLMVAAMAQIETRPETWNQSCYGYLEQACGFTGCLAGWMAELHPGVRWLNGNVQDVDTGEIDAPFDWFVRFTGMGLSDGKALVRGDNEMEHLRAAVKAYLNDESVEDAVYEVRMRLR